eukprot:COSAG01_NODE_8693_length_2695_cov_2.444915_2_plen_135_part_00
MRVMHLIVGRHRRSRHNSSRTLSDEVVKLISQHGGVLGIGLWPKVHSGAQFGAIVRTIVAAIALAGPQAVSIGSDFDGGVSVPAGLDAAGMAHLSAGLLQAGLPPRTVSQVLGGNALRVLGASLPDEAAAPELR